MKIRATIEALAIYAPSPYGVGVYPVAASGEYLCEGGGYSSKANSPEAAIKQWERWMKDKYGPTVDLEIA